MADGTSASHEFTSDDIYRAQRTERGKLYEQLRSELREKMRDESFAKKRDASIREMRAVSPTQVHKNTFMSNLSVQYKNDDYIGEELMPVLPVDKKSNAFPTYPKRERLGGIDDSLKNHSNANELSQSRGEDSYQLADYGLQDFVPGDTLENEDPAFDEMVDLQEGLLEQLALNREIRIATILNTAGNFGSSVTLSGSDQWDASTGGAPIKDLQTAISTVWTGRGPGDLVGFCSIDVWNVLSRHAQTLDLYKGTLPGLTKMDRLAQELGLSKILVGAARKDTANSGQTASYSRIWGKHFGVVRVARRASLRNASFGYTLRMRNHPTSYQWFDPKKGVAGTYNAKVAFSEQHKVVASDTGYLIVNAIS
jgi:hypothetical protein